MHAKALLYTYASSNTLACYDVNYSLLFFNPGTKVGKNVIQPTELNLFFAVVGGENAPTTHSERDLAALDILNGMLPMGTDNRPPQFSHGVHGVHGV